MSPILHWPGDDPAGHTLGGKAQGLQRLAGAGAPVPPWCVLPAGAQHDTPEAHAELAAAFHTLAPHGDGGLAVRSSAALEDGANASYAGVFETCFAEDPAALLPAITRVLDSANADPARAYGATQAAPSTPMAVLLQARIQPRCAGVLFSADPAAADPAQAYLEAVHGPGSGLADGIRTPTRIAIDLQSRAATHITPGEDGPEALPADLLHQLATLLLKLEAAFDAPLDIEWAIDTPGRLWILQARPITVLHAATALHPGQCMTSWFFDQRFAEPIRPLTQTRLLPIIAEVALGDALRMRGAPVPTPLLTFYAGQAYVPHALWRAMLRGAPRRFLSADLRQLFPQHCTCAPAHNTLPGMLHYAACALRAVWRERHDVFTNFRAWHRFERELQATLAQPAAHAPAWDPAAWDTLEQRTRRFLQIHRWSILWADYAYRVFRITLALLPRSRRATLDRALRHDLRLITAEANAALAEVHAHPSDTALRDAFRARYGHRSGSLDWAVPTWAEQLPAAPQAATAPHTATAPNAQPAVTAPPIPRGLHAALYPLRKLLELREAQRFTWERILARQRALILHAATTLQAQGTLTEIDDIWFLTWQEFQTAVCDKGPVAPGFHPRRLPDSPILPANSDRNPDPTNSESGTNGNGLPTAPTDPAVPQCAPIDPDTITQRRHAHRVHTRLPRPLFLGPGTPTPPPIGTTLQGLGASSGTVRGTALVLPAHAPLPHALAPGQIAVLVALDPAWTALMAHARGLIIERGGLLSHAAILAREYRVPLVIGLDHATTHLKTGDPIEINGETGTVTKLPR